MTTPPPGWYPSPDAVDMRRWWDGARWTDHLRPTATVAPQATQPWLPQPRSTFDPERVVVVEPQAAVGRSAESTVTLPRLSGPVAVQPYGTTTLPTTFGPSRDAATSYGPAPDPSAGLPRPPVGYGGAPQATVTAGPSPYPAAARPASPEQTEGAVRVVDGLVGGTRSTRAGGLLGGVSMLFFGLVFSAFSLMVVPQLLSAHAGSDETTSRGTVVDLHESTGSKGSRVCSPEASFVVDGTSYRARSGYASSTCPALGASVGVIYTTENPGDGDARVPGSTSSLLLMALFPVVGLCLVLGGLVGTIRGGASALSGLRKVRG